MSALKVTDAAARLGLSASTLNKWRVQGTGPRFVKMGGRVSYRPVDLDQWMESHLRSSTSQNAPP